MNWININNIQPKESELIVSIIRDTKTITGYDFFIGTASKRKSWRVLVELNDFAIDYWLPYHEFVKQVTESIPK